MFCGGADGALRLVINEVNGTRGAATGMMGFTDGAAAPGAKKDEGGKLGSVLGSTATACAVGTEGVEEAAANVLLVLEEGWFMRSFKATK